MEAPRRGRNRQGDKARRGEAKGERDKRAVVVVQVIQAVGLSVKSREISSTQSYRRRSTCPRRPHRRRTPNGQKCELQQQTSGCKEEYGVSYDVEHDIVTLTHTRRRTSGTRFAPACAPSRGQSGSSRPQDCRRLLSARSQSSGCSGSQRCHPSSVTRKS